MEIRIHQSSKGIWVFVDGKHKKTLPRKYKNLITDNINNLSFERRRLTDHERNLLDNALFAPRLQSFLDKLKKTDKHLFALIEKKKVTGVRKVNGRYGLRYEINFEGVYIKCTRQLYSVHPIKLESAFLNY